MPAVQDAYDRRSGRAGSVNIEWFIGRFMRRLNPAMRQRVMIATEYLQTKIVENISRPVTKSIGSRSGRIVVSNRSSPGEYPKADTGHLKNTIFRHVEGQGNRANGYVGTPLDYGMILETQMDRSFLARTLNEEIGTIRTILTEPVR